MLKGSTRYGRKFHPYPRGKARCADLDHHAIVERYSAVPNVTLVEETTKRVVASIRGSDHGGDRQKITPGPQHRRPLSYNLPHIRPHPLNRVSDRFSHVSSQESHQGHVSLGERSNPSIHIDPYRGHFPPKISGNQSPQYSAGCFEEVRVLRGCNPMWPHGWNNDICDARIYRARPPAGDKRFFIYPAKDHAL